MPRGRPALALLILAVLLGIGLRTVVIGEKYAISHDEAISYLAATCHEGTWDRVTTAGLPPFGRWAPADAWHDLVEPGRLGCFGTLSRDLARLDVHPPLYFAVLHVWVEAFGVSVRSGPLLNLPIFVAAALALFGLARRMLRDDGEAALVVFVWAVSPAVLGIAGEARMYDLLALVSILFVWQVVRLASGARASPGALGLLALLAACGLGTQFLFLLVASAGAVYLVVKLAGRGPRAVALPLAAIAAGFAFVYLLDPHFPDSFSVQRSRGLEHFTAAAFRLRLHSTASGLLGFVLPDQVGSRVLRDVLFGVVCAVALAAAVAVWRRRLLRGTGALFFFAWITAGTVGLYLGFLSHGAAMGGKYLAASWPFLAFGPVIALRLASRRRTLLAAGLCLLLVASGVAGSLLIYGDIRRSADPTRYLASSHRVLVDTVRRGVLIPIVFQLRSHEPVFAAPQPFLLAHRERWLPVLARGGLYVSDTVYGSVRRQRLIVRTIRRRAHIRRVERNLRGAGNGVYLVSSSPAGGRP